MPAGLHVLVRFTSSSLYYRIQEFLSMGSHHRQVAILVPDDKLVGLDTAEKIGLWPKWSSFFIRDQCSHLRLMAPHCQGWNYVNKWNWTSILTCFVVKKGFIFNQRTIRWSCFSRTIDGSLKCTFGYFGIVRNTIARQHWEHTWEY